MPHFNAALASSPGSRACTWAWEHDFIRYTILVCRRPPVYTVRSLKQFHSPDVVLPLLPQVVPWKGCLAANLNCRVYPGPCQLGLENLACHDLQFQQLQPYPQGSVLSLLYPLLLLWLCDCMYTKFFVSLFGCLRKEHCC